MFNEGVFNRFRDVDHRVLKFPPKEPLPLLQALIRFIKEYPILVYPILQCSEVSQLPEQQYEEFKTTTIHNYSKKFLFFTQTAELEDVNFTDFDGDWAGHWQKGRGKEIHEGNDPANRVIGKRVPYHFRDSLDNETGWKLHLFEVASTETDVQVANQWKLACLYR